jgi:hypothetical protein
MSQLHNKNADLHGYMRNNDACSYTQVASQCRSQGGSLSNLRSNAVGTAVPTAGQYVVPGYPAIGYDALTHGNAGGGCNNYFNIEQAYGVGAGSCSTSYSTRACGGCSGGSQVAQSVQRRR